MRSARFALTLLLCALPFGALAAEPYYVMRHLHTPEGERDPDLTREGRESAGALASWFSGKPLAAIYASDYKRTRQTAAALAAERNLVPKIYDPADTPALIERVRAERGPVLVIGHSNTVPDIVEQLGGARPADLSHSDFGDLWIIEAGRTAQVRLD